MVFRGGFGPDLLHADLFEMQSGQDTGFKAFSHTDDGLIKIRGHHGTQALAVPHIQDQSTLHLVEDCLHHGFPAIDGQHLAFFGQLAGQFPAKLPQADHHNVFFLFHPIMILLSGY